MLASRSLDARCVRVRAADPSVAALLRSALEMAGYAVDEDLG